MGKTTIQIRVDEKTKAEAQKVLTALNISTSEAVKLFLRQVVLHKGIPFEVKIPNALTRQTLKKAQRAKM